MIELTHTVYQSIGDIVHRYDVTYLCTFSNGSMCVTRVLATGSSPEGSVSLVLSIYIGLHNDKQVRSESSDTHCKPEGEPRGEVPSLLSESATTHANAPIKAYTLLY